jgi:endo-1,4-beta-xylanase
MLYLAYLLAGIIATVDVAAAAPQLSMKPRQTRWAIQSWANDFADVDFENGDDGEFSVTWDDGFAGNFVYGKGYRPGGDM